MRRVLLRINVADPWSMAPIDSLFGVGAGYLLVAGLLIWGLITLWEYRKAGEFIPASLVAPSVAIGVVAYLAWQTPSMLADGVPIFGYGMMVFFGFLFGGWTALRRAPRVGINPQNVWDMVTWLFIAGVGGARLFYLVQYREEVYANVNGLGEFLFRTVNLTDGGLVLLGGVIASIGAVTLFCRARRIPPMLMGDVTIPSFFIGLGFGRLGCLLNGCCFGDRCSLPWALHFPQGSAAFTELNARGYIAIEAASTYGLHPTQLYSSLAAFLIAGLTAAYFRRRPFDGSVLVVGMLLYSIARFIIEFLRGDEFGKLGTMFTISQWISAGIFVGGLVLWGVLVARGRSAKTLN